VSELEEIKNNQRGTYSFFIKCLRAVDYIFLKLNFFILILITWDLSRIKPNNYDEK
jgi:hypothetical protein